MTVYAAPGQPDSLVSLQPRYGHFIGGQWVDPIKGQWFENISPVNGKPFTEIARGTAEGLSNVDHFLGHYSVGFLGIHVSRTADSFRGLAS